jgi:hypothetical protein
MTAADEFFLSSSVGAVFAKASRPTEAAKNNYF